MTAVVGTMTMLVLVTALSLSSVLMENQPLCKDNSACVEGHSFFKFDIGGELQSMFKYYMGGGVIHCTSIH